MPRLSKQDLGRVREIESLLDTFSASDHHAMGTVVPALRRLLGTDSFGAYATEPDGDGLRLGWMFADNLPADRCKKLLAAVVAGPERWGAYDPISPERRQRNVTLSIADLAKWYAVKEWPIQREMFSRLKLNESDQLRTLVCDGPSLVAWVGGFQPQRFTQRQKLLFARLIPSLTKRLTTERMLDEGAGLRGAFEAAFEAIPSAAFLCDAKGTVFHANAAGRAAIDAQRGQVREILRGVVRGDPRAVVTKVVVETSTPRYLAVLRPDPEGALESRALLAAARWGFTRRQRQILCLLVRGKSNRTIATVLKMAPRTVEVHLTSMFARASVEGRAQLVARVWV